LDPQGEGAIVTIGRVEGTGVVARGATGWKAGAVTVTIDAAEEGQYMATRRSSAISDAASLVANNNV
jgi:hypothetical protein